MLLPSIASIVDGATAVLIRVPSTSASLLHHHQLQQSSSYLSNVSINSILAMTSYNPATGALVLVPIAIALSLAFIAVKTSHFSGKFASFCRRVWGNRSPLSSAPRSRGRKLRRSNLSSVEVYGDSWCDLRSIDSREELPRFNKKEVRSASIHNLPAFTGHSDELLDQIWHPSRSTRLSWAFTNRRSLSPHLFASSSVAKPSPVVHPETRSEDAKTPLEHRYSTRKIRMYQKTDP